MSTDKKPRKPRSTPPTEKQLAGLDASRGAPLGPGETTVLVRMRLSPAAALWVQNLGRPRRKGQALPSALRGQLVEVMMGWKELPDAELGSRLKRILERD